MSALTKENVTAAAERILAITRDLYPELIVETGDVSDRARTLDRFISKAGFGCNEKSVRGLVAMITGEKLPPVRDTSGKHQYCQYTVLYCETDQIAAIIMPVNEVYDWHGKKRDSGWTWDKGNTRLPTIEEVRDVLWANRSLEKMNSLRTRMLLGLA